MTRAIAERAAGEQAGAQDVRITDLSHLAGYKGTMGKNNRQRRAAKAHNRRRAAGSQRGGGARRPTWAPFAQADDPWFTPADRFILAVRAHQAREDGVVTRLVEQLAALPRTSTAGVVAGYLEDQVAHVWRHGWQPLDVDRVVGRELSRPEVELVRAVVRAQSAGYRELGLRVAPAWMAQLDQIGAAGELHRDRAYLLHQPGHWPATLLAAVRAMALLTTLPALPVLADPPERWVDGPSVSSGSLPPSVLDKVRALLAKAESTTFEAEADAFTAKAQELMARHRIDRAVLDAGRKDGHEQPVGSRIGVDDPYADAKALLLGGIAAANGCRAVWSKQLGFTTVFGFADELAAVEELFTSLLVQATVALRREGSKQDRHGRSRTTRFRRSFLVAFAHRIACRLTETVAATVDAACEETGAALAPILASRDAAAAAAAEEAFPDVGSFAPSATDGEGWYAGTLFGDQADLALGPELTPEARVAASCSRQAPQATGN